MDEKERMKYINEELRSALYPTEEELKHQVSRAADNMEIGRLNNEIKYLKAVIEKQNEILSLLRRNIVLDEDYSTDVNGSTRAFKMLVENCVSVEEDEQYTDDCYPNSDFDKIEEWMIFYGK